jgi:hypothetical protein
LHRVVCDLRNHLFVMRRALLWIAMVGLVLGATAPNAATLEDVGTADGRPQPIRYDLALRWRPSTRTLTGSETIRLRNAGTGALRAIWLRLWPNDSIPGEADGCRDRKLQLSALRGATVSRYAVACSAVELALARPLASGETSDVRMRIRLAVPTGRALLGRSAGIDLFGRALPVLAVRDRRGWHLNADTAVGDPEFGFAAAWHAVVRMPKSVEVASTGAEVSNRVEPTTGDRVVVADAARARDFGLAFGHLTTRSQAAAGVKVRVFFSPRTRAAAADRALRNAIDAVRAYTRWYGPYGEPELDVVITDLGADSQELPGLIFTDPDRATVAHEVAHQWFYGIVGNDQYREPWLDEAFASWSELQLAPGDYGCDTARPLGDHRGGLARGLRYYAKHPRLYVPIIYEGGACALDALAEMLGRDRFLALVRAEVEQHRNGVIDTAGFMRLLEQTDAQVAARWADLVGLPLPA